MASCFHVSTWYKTIENPRLRLTFVNVIWLRILGSGDRTVNNIELMSTYEGDGHDFRSVFLPPPRKVERDAVAVVSLDFFFISVSYFSFPTRIASSCLFGLWISNGWFEREWRRGKERWTRWCGWTQSKTLICDIEDANRVTISIYLHKRFFSSLWFRSMNVSSR